MSCLMRLTQEKETSSPKFSSPLVLLADSDSFNAVDEASFKLTETQGEYRDTRRVIETQTTYRDETFKTLIPLYIYILLERLVEATLYPTETISRETPQSWRQYT